MKYGDEENCDWNIGQLRSKGFKSREDERAAHLFDTWNIYMLYLPFGLISAITLSLLAHMYYTVYLRTLDIHDEGAKFIMRSIHHLLYYPLIMAIFWFPNLIIMIWKGNLARHTVQEQKYIIPILLGSYLWSSVYPVGVALYYFYRSDEARMRWRETLCGASAQVSNEDMVVDAQQDKLSRRRKQGSGRAIKNPAHQDSIDVDL